MKRDSQVVVVPKTMARAVQGSQGIQNFIATKEFKAFKGRKLNAPA
jgi:hypothetical protein